MRFEMPKDAMTRDALYLGAMVAAVAAAGLWVIGGWNFLAALVGGLGMGAAVILVMVQLELRIREHEATDSDAQPEGQGAATPVAAASSTDAKAAPAPAAATAPAVPVPNREAAAPTPAPTPTAAPEPAPEAAPAAETAPAAAPAQEATPDPAPAAASEAAKPVGLKAAPEGGGDDLKLIKGVGPKLETLLQELGIYSFAQIADWSAAEMAWMDDNLKGFRGRVSRDDWVGQAKALAEGETTEFAARVKEGGVY